MYGQYVSALLCSWEIHDSEIQVVRSEVCEADENFGKLGNVV